MKINRYSLGLQLNIAHDRIIRILLASPETLAAIDRVLDGDLTPPKPKRKEPYLITQGRAAEVLGVSRATLWRMQNVGKLERVEILPNTYRVRQEDLENLVFGGRKASIEEIPKYNPKTTVE